MKIVQVSVHDSGGGGADRAAYRLHTGLRRLGHDSVMFVYQRTSDDPKIIEFSRTARWSNRMVRRLRREWIRRSSAGYQDPRIAGHELFSDDRSEYGSDLLRQLPTCEVVNLHWIAGLLDYRSFFAGIPHRVPVVWTLHDMNPFTGGCYYDEGCDRYTGACGRCPQLSSHDDQDLSRQIWRRKRRAFERIPPGGLYIVANSRWLAAEAARSSLMGNLPITAIHYGLDVEAFAPRDRLHARSVLGVPADAALLLFGAASVENLRKGFRILRDAVAGLRKFPNLMLLTFGKGRPAVPSDVPHIHFGHVEGDRLLSVLYSAADVFVMPSSQEAFGQTALEAMACGTPVIASAVGGIPEVVRDGVTGYLINPLDAAALQEAVCGLLQDPSKRAEMSLNCRRIVLNNHTIEVQARCYAELYERILRDDGSSIARFEPWSRSSQFQAISR